MSNKIRELTIENFRGIDRLELSLLTPKGDASDLVVLAGPNGCGKTSVLEAIAIALGFPNLVRGKVGRSAVRIGHDDFRIVLSLGLTCDSREIPLGKPIVCTSSNDRPKMGTISYFSSWREPILKGALGITAGKKGRRPAKTEENRLWKLKQFLIDSKAKDLFYGSPSSGTGTSNTRFIKALQRLNKAWQRFYPDQSFLVEPVDNSDDSGFDVFVSGPSQPRVSIDEMSSGQIEVFQIVGDLITVSPIPDILLIDEPELHLDPAWHTQILRAIQDLVPQTQLIVATHSPKIYDSAMSFERHFLVPDDDPRARFWPKGDATSEVGCEDRSETSTSPKPSVGGRLKTSACRR